MAQLVYPKELDSLKVKGIFDGKRVLITGGSGALGSTLITKLLGFNVKEIIVFSRDEKRQDEIKRKHYDKCLKYILGDIKDYHSIRDAVRGADIVIHAAAFKYINLAEKQVSECVKTNVIGSLNVINAVKDEKNIEICLGISTDKASSPINVYGMSKTIMERLFCEADETKGNLKTRFLTVRYGNVLMTTGSVVPIWKEKVQKGEPLPVTDPNMTRFIFTLNDSINLIFYALVHGNSGDIISVKMPAVLLNDLAEVVAQGKVPVKIVGMRPGEKINECLIADFECKDTIDLGDNYLIRPNSNIGLEFDNGVKKPFTSDEAVRLNKEDVKELLYKINAL